MATVKTKTSNIEVSYLETGKAKWVSPSKQGRWQDIKEDKGGTFIRKGTDKIYFEIELPPKDKEEDPIIPDEDLEDVEVNKRLYYAYHCSKREWAGKFPNDDADDFYHWRQKVIGMKKSFFIKNKYGEKNNK